MLKRAFCAALLSASFAAAPVSAEQHKVYFVGNGFFPTKTYAQPGDTIEIINFHTDSAEVTVDGLVIVMNAPPPDGNCSVPAWLADYPILEAIVNLWLAFNPDAAGQICHLTQHAEFQQQTGHEDRVRVIGGDDIELGGSRNNGGTMTPIDNPGLVIIGESPDLGS